MNRQLFDKRNCQNNDICICTPGNNLLQSLHVERCDYQLLVDTELNVLCLAREVSQKILAMRGVNFRALYCRLLLHQFGQEMEQFGRVLIYTQKACPLLGSLLSSETRLRIHFRRFCLAVSFNLSGKYRSKSMSTLLTCRS